jgi:hypothetical protein
VIAAIAVVLLAPVLVALPGPPPPTAQRRPATVTLVHTCRPRARAPPPTQNVVSSSYGPGRRPNVLPADLNPEVSVESLNPQADGRVHDQMLEPDHLPE